MLPAMNEPIASACAVDVAAAAIVDDRTIDVDRLLASIVRQWKDAGSRVRGCMMKRPPREAGCPTEMILVDIDTAEEYLVSQPMGAGSKGCRADLQGFAKASGIFRAALEQTPDLVVSNRFGDLEVQRGGFVTELLAVMERGIPLLTTVSARNVGAWQEFTGGARLLAPDEATMACTGALAARTTLGGDAPPCAVPQRSSRRDASWERARRSPASTTSLKYVYKKRGSR